MNCIRMYGMRHEFTMLWEICIGCFKIFAIELTNNVMIRQLKTLTFHIHIIQLYINIKL